MGLRGGHEYIQLLDKKEGRPKSIHTAGADRGRRPSRREFRRSKFSPAPFYKSAEEGGFRKPSGSREGRRRRGRTG